MSLSPNATRSRRAHETTLPFPSPTHCLSLIYLLFVCAVGANCAWNSGGAYGCRPWFFSLSFSFLFFSFFFFSSACSFLPRQSGKPGQSTKLVRSAHLYPVMCVTPEGGAVTSSPTVRCFQSLLRAYKEFFVCFCFVLWLCSFLVYECCRG